MLARMDFTADFNPDNVPFELRTHEQWALCSKKKVPIQVGSVFNGRWIGAKSNDPTTLTSYENMCYVLRQGHGGIVCGAVALTKSMGVICIDLDDPVAKIEHGLLTGGLTQEQADEALPQAEQWIAYILATFRHYGAYVERSVSGKGWHIFFRGTLSAARYALGFFGSVYDSAQFIYVTGNLDGGTHADWLPDLQGVWDQMVATLGAVCRPITAAEDDDSEYSGAEYTEEPYTAHGRAVGLSDEDILWQLERNNAAIWNAYNGADGVTRDWSQDTRDLLGTLEKLSGDASQIRRLMETSPRMRNAGTNAKGESRWDKFFGRKKDHFLTELKRSRVTNDEWFEKGGYLIWQGKTAAMVEHGKLMATLLEFPPIGQRYVSTLDENGRIISTVLVDSFGNDLTPPTATEIQVATDSIELERQRMQPKAAGNALDGLFQEGALVGAATIEEITPYMRLPAPDAQEIPNFATFYSEVLEMMPHPNSVCAWAAALGSTAHLTQRSYFAGPTYVPLSLYVMFLAGTSDSKDAIVDTPTQVNKVLAEGGEQNRTLIASFVGKMSNGAAVHPTLVECNGRVTMAVREGHNLFGGGSGGKVQLDSNMLSLKETVLACRTLGGLNKVLAAKPYTKGPRTDAVMVASVTTMSESQPHRFYGQIESDDYETGDLGRWLVFNGQRAKQGPLNRNMRTAFGDGTKTQIHSLAAQASAVGHLYSQRPEKFIHIPLTAEAERLATHYSETVIETLDSKLDMVKHALMMRSYVNAMAVAGNIAAFENPTSPVITHYMLRLALELIAIDRTDLIARIKNGETGSTDRNRLDAIRKWIVELYPKQKHARISRQMQKDNVVPWWWLNNLAGNNKAFNSHKLGQELALKNTLRTLVEIGALRVLPEQAVKTQYGVAQQAFAVLDLSILTNS